jgi:cytochrome c biogenesis protein CcdA
MLRLLGIVLSIGFADSLNPTTIAPALVLATGKRARHSIAMFTLGVFSVYFFGGLLVALGPGELLLALIPKPSHNVVQIIEVIAGVVLIVAAFFLWRHRAKLAEKEMPTVKAGTRTGFWLGATIMLVELPTAFPYFARLAAVIGSHKPIPVQVGMILIFNLVFIWPLLAIYAILWIYGDRAEAVIDRARNALQDRWPVLLAGVALLAGAVVITLGLTGIIRHEKLLQHAKHLLHSVEGKLK